MLIDSRLDLAPTAKILKGEPPIVFTVSQDAAKRRALEALGVEVVTAPVDPHAAGKTDLAAIARELGTRGFNEVTVETGAKLMGSLLTAGVIDELVLYLAPKLLGDSAMGLFALPEITRLEQALKVRIVDVRQFGDDLRVTAHLVAPAKAGAQS